MNGQLFKDETLSLEELQLNSRVAYKIPNALVTDDWRLGVIVQVSDSYLVKVRSQFNDVFLVSVDKLKALKDFSEDEWELCDDRIVKKSMSSSFCWDMQKKGRVLRDRLNMKTVVVNVPADLEWVIKNAQEMVERLVLERTKVAPDPMVVNTLDPLVLDDEATQRFKQALTLNATFGKLSKHPNLPPIDDLIDEPEEEESNESGQTGEAEVKKGYEPDELDSFAYDEFMKDL